MHELHPSAWGTKLSTVAVTLITLMVAFAPQPLPDSLRVFAILAALIYPVLARALAEGREWARLLVGELQVLSWTIMTFGIAGAALGRGSGMKGEESFAAALWMAVAVVGCFPKPLLGSEPRRRFAQARAGRKPSVPSAS
jgi:hypothetical protein